MNQKTIEVIPEVADPLVILTTDSGIEIVVAAVALLISLLLFMTSIILAMWMDSPPINNPLAAALMGVIAGMILCVSAFSFYMLHKFTH